MLPCRHELSRRSGESDLFCASSDLQRQNEHAAELFVSSKGVQNIKQLVVQQNKQFGDALATCVASKHPFDPVLVEATLHGCQGDVPLLLSLVRDDSEVLRILGLSLSPLERKLVEDTKSRLTSLVAQELRSPLNGMVGLTMALCKNPALSAVKKQLGMLRSSSSRLLDLVTNVTDMGQCPPQESKVNFAELVEEVLVMTSLAVDRSNLPLVKPGVELHNQLRYMDRLPLVSGDRNKFIHLVYNLVTNACKFTAVGSVTISAKHLAESSELEIIVEDTGCGISESCLPRIFEPFRIDAARPKQVQTFQGAGLGLAVCKEIAELHHGTIMAESRENEGSTFMVKFPCLPEFGAVEDDMPSPASRSVTVPPQQAQTLMAPRLAAPSRTLKTRPVILHVELDAKIQMFFKQSFADEYEILTASGVNNIEEWLQEKDQQKLPDIILLDLCTPQVLCHKVCTLCRQLRQPPALLVSVDTPGMLAMQTVDEKLKESALLKPFDVDALKKKFSAVLKEPLKMGESLEKTLVELMTMKTALLEDQFQNTLTSQVQVQLDGNSKRSKDSKGSGCKPKVQKDTGEKQQDRSRSLAESEIERLEEEGARDIRLADHIQYQSSLNKAVLQEFGTATSSSRFPVEKVNLSELIDEILAKVQAGKVVGLDRFSSPGGIQFHNGLKELVPIVMGNRSMIEHMIVKLLEQCAMLMGSVREVSIIGKKLPNESIEVTLDWPRGDKETIERPRRRSAVQSFSLRCFTSHALHCEATRERPLLLAVDDEETHQSVLRSTLGSDFQVVCHVNGQAALDWLEGQGLPDIILLDTEMPGLTGYEVCKSIREKYGSISELPVILMYDKPPSPIAALEGFDSGSNDLITKPFDLQLLKEKVSFQLGMDEVNVMQEVQKQKIHFLEMRVLEQASQIGQLRDCQKERRGPDQRSAPCQQDLQPELERWKLRSMQVAKRLLLQSQSFAAAEVAIT
eukprot:s3117_g3.t1